MSTVTDKSKLHLFLKEQVYRTLWLKIKTLFLNVMSSLFFNEHKNYALVIYSIFDL